jgi:hypothetical protein
MQAGEHEHAVASVRTSDTPNASVLAIERGNTVKSTARMQKHVAAIMIARNSVTATSRVRARSPASASPRASTTARHMPAPVLSASAASTDTQCASTSTAAIHTAASTRDCTPRTETARPASTHSTSATSSGGAPLCPLTNATLLARHTSLADTDALAPPAAAAAVACAASSGPDAPHSVIGRTTQVACARRAN